MKKLLVAAALIGTAASLLACETDTTQSEIDYSTECRDAALDGSGTCRYGDGRFAPGICCPGNEERVVSTTLDLVKLIELVTEGVESHTYWEDEGVSCGAKDVRGHEIGEVLTDEHGRFTGLGVIVEADLPYDYCGGYGATSTGTCWVRLEMHDAALEVVDVECEEG